MSTPDIVDGAFPIGAIPYSEYDPEDGDDEGNSHSAPHEEFDLPSDSESDLDVDLHDPE